MLLDIVYSINGVNTEALRAHDNGKKSEQKINIYIFNAMLLCRVGYQLNFSDSDSY